MTARARADAKFGRGAMFALSLGAIARGCSLLHKAEPRLRGASVRPIRRTAGSGEGDGFLMLRTDEPLCFRKRLFACFHVAGIVRRQRTLHRLSDRRHRSG